jgi:hypothetical protein
MTNERFPDAVFSINCVRAKSPAAVWYEVADPRLLVLVVAVLFLDVVPR